MSPEVVDTVQAAKAPGTLPGCAVGMPVAGLGGTAAFAEIQRQDHDQQDEGDRQSVERHGKQGRDRGCLHHVLDEDDGQSNQRNNGNRAGHEGQDALGCGGRGSGVHPLKLPCSGREAISGCGSGTGRGYARDVVP
ncbi:hypothetical protein B879_04204 [Cecembia lonarensis LW9]|uniref:Uncharacterized protein n=1 Tax=Cecembia lonarensis (strain CCUG 58316 / KCTC 22772 / LW9) TaxID=1225176 RepID=K1L598_CECL9|nr:hypothetical protein B879_04204 [Cecembia lonarensis LW9]